MVVELRLDRLCMSKNVASRPSASACFLPPYRPPWRADGCPQKGSLIK